MNGVPFGEHHSGISDLEKAIANLGNSLSNFNELQFWLTHPRGSGSKIWGKTRHLLFSKSLHESDG